YSSAFAPARVTDLEGYVAQTLGNTIAQLQKVTLVAVVAGLLVSVLMTALFLKMLIAKDGSQIAIMKSLGFSLGNIRVQYLTKTFFLLLIGILLGTIFANTTGQRLVSMLWSFMGAAQIHFIIDPIQAYLLFPLLLLLTVSVTTVISIAGIKETSIIQMITE
ncbi:MAG TPA: FtsX-like permease family protein, partial [Caldilineaceae bacterium]|nr:FtsX-like permease family protein [Caldilineaceae bacterium]